MSDETVCGFGGSGGTVRPPFVLRDDETIAAIEGGSGDALDRIQFVTSSGRQSPPFGGAGGAPFRLELPEGRAIGGLQITQSGALLFPSSHRLERATIRRTHSYPGALACWRAQCAAGFATCTG